jgi:hypothetical protein
VVYANKGLKLRLACELAKVMVMLGTEHDFDKAAGAMEPGASLEVGASLLGQAAPARI